MIWIYSALRATSTKNRLALLIAGLRWIGILVFALLSGYFVTQDAYLEIDHINTDGFGLDRGNNGSPGPGTRTLFIIGYTVFLGPRLTAGAPEFLSFSQSDESPAQHCGPSRFDPLGGSADVGQITGPL